MSINRILESGTGAGNGVHRIWEQNSLVPRPHPRSEFQTGDYFSAARVKSREGRGDQWIDAHLYCVQATRGVHDGQYKRSKIKNVSFSRPPAWASCITL